ncbi:hypothetical protein KJ708_03955 [bacterium]|nr:hypothetical protein [bacterium]
MVSLSYANTTLINATYFDGYTAQMPAYSFDSQQVNYPEYHSPYSPDLSPFTGLQDYRTFYFETDSFALKEETSFVLPESHWQLSHPAIAPDRSDDVIPLAPPASTPPASTPPASTPPENIPLIAKPFQWMGNNLSKFENLMINSALSFAGAVGLRKLCDLPALYFTDINISDWWPFPVVQNFMITLAVLFPLMPVFGGLSLMNNLGVLRLGLSISDSVFGKDSIESKLLRKVQEYTEHFKELDPNELLEKPLKEVLINNGLYGLMRTLCLKYKKGIINFSSGSITVGDALKSIFDFSFNTFLSALSAKLFVYFGTVDITLIDAVKASALLTFLQIVACTVIDRSKKFDDSMGVSYRTLIGIIKGAGVAGILSAEALPHELKLPIQLVIGLALLLLAIRIERNTDCPAENSA